MALKLQQDPLRETEYTDAQMLDYLAKRRLDGGALCETIARQKAGHRALEAIVKAESKKRTKPIRFKRDDVDRIVREVLADLAREIRHQAKVTPAWGRALHWAAAKVDADAATVKESLIVAREFNPSTQPAPAAELGKDQQ